MTLNARFLTYQGTRSWRKVPTWRWIRQQQGLSRVHTKHDLDRNSPFNPDFKGAAKTLAGKRGLLDNEWQRMNDYALVWIIHVFTFYCLYIANLLTGLFMSPNIGRHCNALVSLWYNWFLISPVHGDGCEDDWYLIEAREQSSQPISRHT